MDATPIQNLQNLHASLDGQRDNQPNYQEYLNQYSYSLYSAAAAFTNSHFIDGTNAANASNIVNKKASGRQTYNSDQKRTLEEEFHRNKYVTKAQRQTLSAETGLSDKQIKIWFQNRRMKKKKQDQGLYSGEMTQESSPSSSLTPNTRIKQEARAFGAAVKSEPENGVQQQPKQEMKSDSPAEEQPFPSGQYQQQQIAAFPFYSNHQPLAQQFIPTWQPPYNQNFGQHSWPQTQSYFLNQQSYPSCQNLMGTVYNPAEPIGKEK